MAPRQTWPRGVRLETSGGGRLLVGSLCGDTLVVIHELSCHLFIRRNQHRQWRGRNWSQQLWRHPVRVQCVSQFYADQTQLFILTPATSSVVREITNFCPSPKLVMSQIPHVITSLPLKYIFQPLFV
jgi:hypothetical protein